MTGDGPEADDGEPRREGLERSEPAGVLHHGIGRPHEQRHLVGPAHHVPEAARLEGASLAKLLGSIVLPAAAPIVAATAIVLFVLDWNMLLIPLVLTGIDVRTLPVILTDFFTLEREVEWPTAAAALTISLVPLLILVGLFHRLLERFSLGGDASEPA